MDFLNKRPLAAFAGAFYICACILFPASHSVITAAIVISFMAFAVLMAVRSRVRFRFARALILMTAGALAASLFAGLVAGVWLARIQEFSGTETTVTGTVTDVSYASAYSGCYILETDPDSPPAGKIKLMLYTDSGEYRIGDRLRTKVLLRTYDNSGDLGEYMLAGGVVLIAENTEGIELIGRASGIKLLPAMLRDRLVSKLSSAMSAEPGGFASALILGDRSRLGDSTARDFRVLGISHIIALSGTHLTALFAAAGGLIPDGRRRGTVRFALLCPAVLFYVILTGAPSTIVRSGIMFILTAFAGIAGRKTDILTSLSAAVLLICIVSPYSPWDIGLQLSFAAVTGLVISDVIGKEIPSKLRRMIPALTVPAVMLPLTWLRFGEVSLATALSNIVLVPVISLFIPILGILLLLSGVPAVFIPLASAVDRAISLVLGITETAASAWDHAVPLRGFICGVAVIAFAAAMITAILGMGKLRRIAVHSAVLLLAAAVLTAQVYAADSHRGVTLCHVSSGTDDSVCVISGGTTVLIDMGRYPTAAASTAELAAQYGSGRIDAFMLTHLHQGHRLTLSVIAANYFVSTLWIPMPEDPESESIAESLANEATALGLQVYTYLPGETLYVGECTLTAPSAVSVKTSSHSAISLAVEYGGFRISCATAGADPGGDVNIISAHGPSHSGTAAEYVGYTILSGAAAAAFDAVPSNSVISDETVIAIRPGRYPTVCTDGGTVSALPR